MKIQASGTQFFHFIKIRQNMKNSTVLQWLATALFILSCPLLFYAQNLLSNQSCESGSTPPGSNWVEVSGGWTCQAGSGVFPPAQDGSYLFFAGTSTPAELRQDVDVSGNATNIDSGNQEYVFSSYVRDYSGNDQSQVIVEYRKADGTVLSTYDSGPYAQSASWQNITDTRTAPVGTRVIRVRLISLRQAGSDNDGYHDNVSLTLGSLLPVELTYFGAKNMGQNTLLTWQTSSETNNAGFQIQHSTNGRDWKNLQFIDGRGTTDKEQDYSYRHLAPQAGINYYRLRQMDFDGAHKFSKTISISFHGNENGFSLLPNPVGNGGKLSVRFDHENEGTLNVFSFTGQRVYHRAVNEGQLDLNVRLPHLPQGIYMVEWLTGQGRFVEKLMIE
ncbi:MAG TPA: T9SS type A sorting domain-containing protein [Bacteroidetes bacterium]|nr:T9SS type A sorting domain-containing protein [Bacteroidota bacterium]